MGLVGNMYPIPDQEIKIYIERVLESFDDAAKKVNWGTCGLQRLAMNIAVQINTLCIGGHKNIPVFSGCIQVQVHFWKCDSL